MAGKVRREARPACNLCVDLLGSPDRISSRGIRRVRMAGIRAEWWGDGQMAEAGMRAAEAVPSLDISEIDTHILPTTARPNRAGALRVGWQARHVVTLCLLDLLVGLCAASAALILRFGPASQDPYLRGYLLLTLTI